jgi:Zn-dependent protease with chaperone function
MLSPSKKGRVMRRILFKLLVLLAAAWIGTLRAEIIVAPQALKTMPSQEVLVPAQQLTIHDLGILTEGEGVFVQVDVTNATYKDLGVRVVDAANMALARQNLPFQHVVGEFKKNEDAPFRIKGTIVVGGPHYLVLDNSFANFINKKVVYQLAFLKRRPEEEIAAIKTNFGKFYAALKQGFEFKDFNIRIAPCGQANAYSTTATGDVTLCTEMFDEMSARPGAITAVLFHEMGHTLMNLWGYPNFGNEDNADQFATIMLLKFGETGKKALYEWIQWYADHDSRAQAEHMLISGDTHSLSIQRIRNIQASMQNSADLMRRWNNILYPHMTDWALKGIVDKPASFDDADAAKRELSKRARLK